MEVIASKKLKNVSLKWVCTSSAQAEYLSLYYGAREAIYIGYLVEEIFEKKIFPIKGFIDNMSVIQTLHKSVPTNVNKHFKTKFFALNQWIEEGLLDISYVPTAQNKADGMTKSLNEVKFNSCFDTVLEERGSIQTVTQLARSHLCKSKCKPAQVSLGNTKKSRREFIGINERTQGKNTDRASAHRLMTNQRETVKGTVGGDKNRIELVKN